MISKVLCPLNKRRRDLLGATVRQGATDDQHASMRRTCLECPARQLDEVVSIERHQDPVLARGVFELFLVRQPLASRLVNAQDVETLIAADDSDGGRKIFVEEELHREWLWLVAALPLGGPYEEKHERFFDPKGVGS